MSEKLFEKPKGLLDFLSAVFLREPQDKTQLVEVLRDAEQRELLDAEALGMVESAMQLSEMQVRDVMTTIFSSYFCSRGSVFRRLYYTSK